MKSDLIDVSLLYKGITKSGLAGKFEDENGDFLTLPLSVIEMHPAEPIYGSEVEVTLPQSMAQEKGLI